MGGYVALAFVRRHAGRLRGLILADTRAEADTAEGKANRDKLIAFAGNHDGREVLDQMLDKIIGPQARTAQPAVVEELRRIAGVQKPAAIQDALRAMRDRPDSLDLLTAIALPTLVIVGSEDALTPPALAQTLAAKIAGATLVTIPTAGHVANLEQPEAFNTAVVSFLKSLR
jgi:pimeloyl-ACP methyl ester carboxylesterase